MTKENNLISRYLLNELSSEKAIAFEHWIGSDLKNLEKLNKYKAVWERTNNYPKGFNPDVHKALANVHKSAGITQMQKSKSRFAPILKIASIAALIIGMIGLTYYYNPFNTDKIVVINSGMDEVKEIVLPDSSHVWLNENSSLQVANAFTKKQRKVTLKGEAYFEIKRDETKPFIISTGNTFTEILGTSFNIKMDTINGNVSVIVNSGKVAFYSSINKSEKLILKPTDEGIFVGSTSKIIRSANLNINYLTWKTGILTFNDTPLNEVCFELSKYYKKSVKTAAPVSNKSLTGTFKNEKLEDILKTIELTLDVQAEISGNETIIHN
ncbi:MAG TPA: FecR domain-containing protein [Prolixibacteraceae bacterium]|jgi:ferric-dicitrate binding protein FerR (iron transport regulator)